LAKPLDREASGERRLIDKRRSGGDAAGELASTLNFFRTHILAQQWISPCAPNAGCFEETNTNQSSAELLAPILVATSFGV
jgi:hypothetical protein